MRQKLSAPALTILALVLGSACGGAEEEPAFDTSTSAVCTYPTTSTFGVNDAFNLINPDPIPYNPAFPQFVAYLNSIGVATANMKTFDSMTSNRHMVATLRHGLRSCFAGATSLFLCFSARAHADLPGNDSVVVYNTDFTTNTFPVVSSMALVPALTPTWNNGQVATLCIDLTTPMVNGLIGDMLQFRLQDDTAVDFITMTLN